jgi:DNA-binding YbaB/EbfC family protein
MFDGLKDMGKLLKQAGEMKSKMKKIQEELKKVKVTGTAEGGKIEIVISGELEVLDIKVDASLLSPASQNSLQKGLLKAFNDAAKKSKEMATAKLSDISGGLDIPGLTGA